MDPRPEGLPRYSPRRRHKPPTASSAGCKHERKIHLLASRPTRSRLAARIRSSARAHDRPKLRQSISRVRRRIRHRRVNPNSVAHVSHAPAIPTTTTSLGRRKTVATTSGDIRATEARVARCLAIGDEADEHCSSGGRRGMGRCRRRAEPGRLRSGCGRSTWCAAGSSFDRLHAGWRIRRSGDQTPTARSSSMRHEPSPA